MSSSFVLEIYIELENGKTLSFEANGGSAETDIIDYFLDEATVTVSPKQLGMAKSVQELIDLLKNGVYDGWVSHGNKLFENKRLGGRKRKHNPMHFILMIEEYVTSMNDIKNITITGNESSGWRYQEPFYYRTYSYLPKTGEYLRKIEGCEFEKNGSSGGDLIFSDENEAIDANIDTISLRWDMVTTKGYAIRKGKEAKQNMRKAYLLGNTETLLAQAGVANELSQKYARDISPIPETIAFSGKNFVHTTCSNEEMIDKFVLSRGGEVRSSTVQVTDYIIIGNEIDHKTSKIIRAIELNSKGKSIIAMTESEFWTLAAKVQQESSDNLGKVPFCVSITGQFYEFTKSLFEQFVVARGINFKAKPSNLADYVVVNSKEDFNWVQNNFVAKPIYPAGFAELIGLTKIELINEITALKESMQPKHKKGQTSTLWRVVTINGKTFIKKYSGNDVSITIPNTIRGKQIFGLVDFFLSIYEENLNNQEIEYRKSIKEIIIEDGIVEIGRGAFCNCEALEKVTLPASISCIEPGVFVGCKKLTIYTHKNSRAEQYAKENNIPFVAE